MWGTGFLQPCQHPGFNSQVWAALKSRPQGGQLREVVGPANRRVLGSLLSPLIPLCPGGTPVKTTGRRWRLCARLGAFSPWWHWMDYSMPWAAGTVMLLSTLWRHITPSSMSGGEQEGAVSRHQGGTRGLGGEAEEDFRLIRCPFLPQASSCPSSTMLCPRSCCFGGPTVCERWLQQCWPIPVLLAAL